MEPVLPTELLRTFLVLIRTRSFSQTGQEIGRSQSAVSLQMRRLQDIVGSPILTNSGKSLGLTPQGHIVHEYARRIVALNDECVGRLSGGTLTGTIRIGIPSNFALTFLPRILGRFSEANSDIALDVTCELSADLIAMLARREFDIVLAVYDGKPSPYLEHFLTLRNRWGFPGGSICDSRCGLEKEASLHDESSFQRHSQTACLGS